jgi:hypothetical protein
MKRHYTLKSKKSKKSKTRKQSGGNIAMNTHSKVSNVFKKMIPNQSTINATKQNYQSKVRNVFQKVVPSFLLTK